MQTNTETITAARVRAEYDKGVQFNNGLDLYEDVKQCENFVEGRQWEGLKTKTLRPITMNVLDPIVHYKVAQIVSNDVRTTSTRILSRSCRMSRRSTPRRSLSSPLTELSRGQNSRACTTPSCATPA